MNIWRTISFVKDYFRWREELVLPPPHPEVLASFLASLEGGVAGEVRKAWQCFEAALVDDYCNDDMRRGAAPQHEGCGGMRVRLPFSPSDKGSVPLFSRRFEIGRAHV